MLNVPMLDCDDCIAILQMHRTFGMPLTPCAPCVADGVVVTKGVM